MLRVRDAMTREVFTVGPEAGAGEAWGLCREHSIRHLPVVEGGKVVGIVSDRDLRDISPPRDTQDQENALGYARVREIMTTDVITTHPLDTIEHAARVIQDHGFNCLPVVADGELAGIITSSDLVRTLVELIGAGSEGSWIEVEVPNEPGTLAGITDELRNRHVNIAGIFLAPAAREAFRTIVLRLETTDPSSIARTLEGAGYTVTTTESSAPANRNLERR